MVNNQRVSILDQVSTAVTLMVNLFNSLHYGTKNIIIVVLNITILSGSKIVTNDINITVNKHNFGQLVLREKQSSIQWNSTVLKKWSSKQSINDLIDYGWFLTISTVNIKVDLLAC